MSALLWTVLGLAGVVVSGDFVYSRVIHHRMRKWEAGVERTDEGVRVSCVDFTMGTGSTVLLLVHGFADSPAVYRRMAPELAAEGFTCRAIRLTPFAERLDGPTGPLLDKWLAAVDAECDRLRESHEQVWIVGHSMGAVLAMRQALDHPDKVDGLVLLAPLFRVSSARSPVLSPETWHKLAECFLHFSKVIENPVPLDARDPEVAGKHPMDRFVAREVFRALFPLAEDARRRAATLRHPVLMVVPPRDMVVDSAAARAAFEQIPSENKRFFADADSGHVTPLDFGYRRVASLVCEYVRDGRHECTVHAGIVE